MKKWKTIVYLCCLLLILYISGILQLYNDTRYTRYLETNVVHRVIYYDSLHTVYTTNYLPANIILIVVVLFTLLYFLFIYHGIPSKRTVLGRYFLILFFLYLLRCITITVTLYSPVNAECVPYNIESTAEYFTSPWQLVWKRMSCTDLMFSGHTLVIFTSLFFLGMYIRLRSLSLVKYFILWAIGLTGLFFIVTGKLHYTVDVIVSLIITFLTFWFYHAFVYIYTAQDVYGPQNQHHLGHAPFPAYMIKWLDT